MADTWYWFAGSSGIGNVNWSVNNWNDAANGLGNWGTPAPIDVAAFQGNRDNSDCLLDVNKTIDILIQNVDGNWVGTFTIANTKTLTIVGSCECEGTWNHVGTFDLNGVGAMGFQTFAVHTGAGAITIASGILLSAGHDFSGYGGNMTFDGGGAEVLEGGSPSLPAFIIDCAGSLTLDSTTIFKAFTLTAGTFDDGGYSVNCDSLTFTNGTWAGSGNWNVAGNIAVADAGTVSHTGRVTQTDDGTVAWNSATRLAAHLRLGWTAGKTSEITDAVHCKKFSHGAGIVTDAGYDKFIKVTAAANDFWIAGAGTVTARSVILMAMSSLSNASKIKATCSLYLSPRVADGETLTLTGGIDVGTSGLLCMAAGINAAVTPIVDLAGGSINCGAVLLGGGAADYEIALRLGSGIHTVASLTRNNATDTENEVHLESATLLATGTLDCAGIVVSSEDAGRITGGTVSNLTNFTGPRLVAWGVKQGAGNTAYKQIEWSPRQLGMMPLAA